MSGLINLDHYVSAAQAMADMESHKAELQASKQVAQKVNMLGHGGALRNKIASFAGVRDDVRASAVPKRKRRDAHDFRNDLVNSYIPDWACNVTNPNNPSQPPTLPEWAIEHGTHQPLFLGSGYKTSDNTYLQYAHTHRDNFSGLIDLSSPDIDPKFHKATQISQTKKKKRKHENDPGFRKQVQNPTKQILRQYNQHKRDWRDVMKIIKIEKKMNKRERDERLGDVHFWRDKLIGLEFVDKDDKTKKNKTWVITEVEYNNLPFFESAYDAGWIDCLIWWRGATIYTFEYDNFDCWLSGKDSEKFKALLQA